MAQTEPSHIDDRSSLSHAPGIGDGELADLQDLVGVLRCGRVSGARHTERGEAKEGHGFVAEAGGWKEGAERLHMVCNPAGFLLAFAHGRRRCRFIWLEGSSRKLPEPLVDNIAILSDENYAIGSGHGEQDDRAGVSHHFHVNGQAVREADSVHLHAEHTAPENRPCALDVRMRVRHTSSFSVMSSRTLFKSAGSSDENSIRRPSSGCANASRAAWRNGRSSRMTERR